MAGCEHCLRRRSLHETADRAHRHRKLVCTQRSREPARRHGEHANHSVLDGDAAFRKTGEGGFGPQVERGGQWYPGQQHHSRGERCERHLLRMRCGDSPGVYGHRPHQDHDGPNDTDRVGDDPLTVDLDGLGNCRGEWQHPGTCLRRSHECLSSPLDLAGTLTAIRAPRSKPRRVRAPRRNARDFHGLRPAM